jgi:hypothetical protein
MRGAIICFVLQPAAALFVGVYMIALGADPRASQLTSWLALIKYLIVLSFGGPYLFVVMARIIGFPSAAVGLWLRGRISHQEPRLK